MKRWTEILLLAAACGGLQAAERAGLEPEVAQLLPENSRLVSQLDADVTGDGVADTILVAGNDRTYDVRVFIRLHGKTVTGGGQMKGLAISDSLQLEVTPLGPPTVRVVKGVLIVESLAGGATVRTAATYRYRFDGEEGRMRLIGLDAERKSSTFGIRLSWNVLTGARAVRRTQPDAKFQYGPEARTTRKSTPIYMSLTPSPEELLDEALDAERRR